MLHVQTSAIPSLEEMEEEDDIPDEEAVMEVLRKPIQARHDDDCTVLQRATRGVKFFKSLNDPAQHLELCRVMTLERFGLEEHIFDQGDTGSTFYVIYKGGVKVYVKDTKQPQPSGSIGTCVVTLEDGDSFGELALLGNDLRAATCLTAMPSQLLCIEKDAYQKSVERLHQAEHQRRVTFLQRVFLFTDWSDEELGKLAKAGAGQPAAARGHREGE